MSSILIISAVFPPEPVISAMLSHDIAEDLSKKGNVIVLCPKPTRPEGFQFQDQLELKKFKVVRINSFTSAKSQIVGRFRESYSFGNHCVKYIQQNSKEISCIYLNTWPLMAQYKVVKSAKKLCIPCIIHVQDIYPETLINKLPIGGKLFYKILLPIDKYSLKNSCHILCISENMKEILIQTRNILPEKFSVIENWQNEDSFLKFRNLNSKKENDLPAPFTFMYLGNNGPLAGVDFLIRAFIKADILHSKLIIAGSGSRTNSCIELAKSLKASSIEFIAVPDGKVPEIQDRADVMLLSVKTNGAMSSIPSKLLAYMFSAKPIIGSLDLKSSTAKAIIDSNCGIVVEPENEFEIIKAMKEISRWSRRTLLQKGDAGFNYALRHFSKKENLQKVIDIIAKIGRWK